MWNFPVPQVPRPRRTGLLGRCTLFHADYTRTPPWAVWTSGHPHWDSVRVFHPFSPCSSRNRASVEPRRLHSLPRHGSHGESYSPWFGVFCPSSFVFCRLPLHPPGLVASLLFFLYVTFGPVSPLTGTPPCGILAPLHRPWIFRSNPCSEVKT